MGHNVSNELILQVNYCLLKKNCHEGGNLPHPAVPLCVLKLQTSNKMDTGQIKRRKIFLICAERGFIEMGQKEVAKVGSFYTFRQKTINLRELSRQIN